MLPEIYDAFHVLCADLFTNRKLRRRERLAFMRGYGVVASVASANWFNLPDNNEQDWLIPYAAVSGAIGVEVGDLMYDYGSSLDVAYPAGQQASGGSEAADQVTFTAVFCGCSLDKVLSSEVNATRRLVVRTSGVKVFDCPSQAWNKGDLVGIYSDGSASPNSQKVDKVTTVDKAIGICIKGTLGVVATTVTVYFTAKNYTGQKTAGTTLGAVTVSSLVSSASTFPISGQSAAQGGSVTVAGGTSSTAANAGGAVLITGGTPGSTGVGGAVTIAAGAGGSASGAGGVASITGGAGTASNSAGGAATVTGGLGAGTSAGGAATITGGQAGGTNATGGAGQLIGGLGTGSGAGGAITITSGAAGTTGVAGAVNISVGAATAGIGSALTLTAGNGAGSTNGGGVINLIPGTAVSTGIPGEVQVNSAAGIFSANWQQFVAANVPVSGTSYPFFLADRAYRVKGARCMCSSTGTVPTVDVIKDTGTTAPGGGTSVLTGVMTFNTTANTVVVGTASSTIATVTMAAGDRLSTKWGGTVGSLTGAVVTVLLVPA